MKKLKPLVAKLIALLDRFEVAVALLTRITVGFVFVLSGWGKLHHLDKVIEFFTSLGIPAPALQAPFVATTELVCGGLLLVGLAARFVSVPLICTMVVAIITAKRQDISDLNDLFGVSEYLYIVLLAWVVTRGAGCISIDAWLKRRVA